MDKRKVRRCDIIKKGLNFKSIELENEILSSESRTNFIYVNEYNLNILNVYTPNGNPIEDKEKFNFKISWLSEIKKFRHILLIM